MCKLSLFDLIEVLEGLPQRENSWNNEMQAHKIRMKKKLSKLYLYISLFRCSSFYVFGFSCSVAKYMRINGKIIPHSS